MTTAGRRDEALEAFLRRPAGSPLPPTGDDCLDAEAAAAWIDDGLGAAARASIEQHVAGCARCQALVAATVKAGEAAASAPAVEPRRQFRWVRWAAPLAAAAVVLIAVTVWNRAPLPPAREPSREQSSPTAAPAPRETPPQPRETPPQPRRDGAPPPAQPPLARPTAPQSQAFETAGASSADSQSNTAAGATAAEKAAEKAADTAVRAETFRRAAAPPAPAAALAPTAGTVLVSSDPAIRWRFHANSVERSVDGGSSWSDANVGSVPDLLAGSAVSPAVCWIVGRSGIVLVTADGVRWVRHALTPPVDLTGVTATSASAATVRAADGRAFATTDGGSTWQPVAIP